LDNSNIFWSVSKSSVPSWLGYIRA
jgi:hypothetical protein